MALDARTGVCFHIEAHWPGAIESERSMVRTDACFTSHAHGQDSP
jgi:hypothetical protein